MGKKADEALDMLRSVKTTRAESLRLRRRVKELESRCSKMTASYGGVVGGGGGDREELLAALADEASRLKSAYYKEDAAVRRAEHLLDRVPDAVCREVLRLRYLDVLPWTKVQFHMARSGMCYSLRHLHRLHDTGVDMVRREMTRRKRKGDDTEEAEE